MTTTRMPSAPAKGHGIEHSGIGDAILGLAAYWIPFPPLAPPFPAQTSLQFELDLAAGAGGQPVPPALDRTPPITPARGAYSSGRRCRDGDPNIPFYPCSPPFRPNVAYSPCLDGAVWVSLRHLVYPRREIPCAVRRDGGRRNQASSDQ